MIQFGNHNRGLAMLGGAMLALLGVAIVEGLLAAGMRPLTPVGWPGGGMMVAAALFGPAGALGGALVSGGYVLVQSGSPDRFPAFFASSGALLWWAFALTGLTALLLYLRARQMRHYVSAEKLRESEARFRHLTELSSDWYWEQDEQFRFTYTSGHLREQHSGKARSELPVEDLSEEQWREHRARLERHEPFRDLLMRRRDREGRTHWVAISGDPVFDADGRFKGYRGVGRDVTATVEAEQQLRMAKQRLELALEGSSAALWDADLSTGSVYLSDAWADLLGYPPGETVTTVAQLMATVHPDDLDAVRGALVDTIKGRRGDYAAEHRVRAGSGEWRWILSRGRVTERDPESGLAVRMLGTNEDITERKKVEEMLHQEARYDALTGVANRTLLEDRLGNAMARTRRGGGLLAVLYLDIDEFKAINDRLGHAAGDQLLKNFAARLRANVREVDTVARFGGDEFVVLLENLKEERDASAIAEKILAAVREPVAMDAGELCVSTSIGIAVGGADVADILKRADRALYTAKAAGKGRASLAA